MAGFVPPGIAGLLDLFGASWEDRIEEGAYISPTGTRILFQWESVSRNFDKRGTVFTFPGVNGAYVQQKGYSERRYPLRCYFNGKNCDLEASAFEAALLEPGIGKLEHPLYGTIPDVVPFGTVTRRDDLKEEANQSIVEVTFLTTLGAVYPSALGDPRSEIQASILGFDVAAAQQFSDSTSLAGAIERANMKSAIKKFLRETSAALKQASDSVASVRREFADIQSTINFGLDVLVGQPLLLARQCVNLVRAPARAIDGILSRLDAYRNLANSIFESAAGTPGEALAAGTALAVRTTQIANDWHVADLFASSAVASSVATTLETQYETRPQAIAAAEQVLAQMAALVAWRDGGFEALEGAAEIGAFQVDQGDSFQQLQSAVALAAGRLIDISFTLIPERQIVLDRPRTIVDLCAELYGQVDERLDFMIQTNNLTGDEVLELPRKKLIVYYPDA
jgi:hypothetical protein